MTTAHINRIATAVPRNDVHHVFVDFASRQIPDTRHRALFTRMAERSGIAHRFSPLVPAPDAREAVDDGGFYTLGRFPSTAARMRKFEEAAPDLAARAVEGLELGADAARITHLVVISCTGFAAPGLDFALIDRFGLSPSVERTMVGFMGCYAAVNGLKLARHIVRSEPSARVLVVSIELCTLHLQETSELEQLLTFMVFGDGCAAALVTADPVGLSLEGFHALRIPQSAQEITWNVRDQGFDMVLSGRVPAAIGQALDQGRMDLVPGGRLDEVDLWAVHPGGRSVLDAVEAGLDLGPDALKHSRAVLHANGNMSSATIMFVLESLMRAGGTAGASGCGMAFGPGLVAETLTFKVAA